MLPNMYKIAGELTPTVFHVASRSLATQALSIFGDHSDVMAVHASGFALLCSGSVQEAHDNALIAQAATLESRVPFLHFFGGFRTSHEINTLALLSDDQIRAMIDDDRVRAHRGRALDPAHPVVRGTVHNPDTFFQARETVNPFYGAAPAIVQQAMDRFAVLTGRQYHLFEYGGPPDADRVLVTMGTGAETARDTAAALCARGEKVGVVQVRLYRPFAGDAFLAVLPKSCRVVGVIEQTKEPGAPGEPLYLDVMAALAGGVAVGKRADMPRVIGGRYGLSSKDFTPAMAKAVFDELAKSAPRNGFTIGIDDDVSHTSLAYDASFAIEPPEVVRAVFYGLGSDGTVGANKNSVKIIAEEAGLYAQGYFVYNSHKSGAQTISHLRFGPKPVRAPYLIQQANFVACHQFNFVERRNLLRVAAAGAVFLLNSPYGPAAVWDHLPRSMQRQIIAKKLRFFVIDASEAAREVGLRGRTNTILQTCFFALSGVLPRAEAIWQIKAAIRKTYADKGEDVVERNFRAVDGTLERLHAVEVPSAVTSDWDRAPLVPEHAPEFVRAVTARMLEGRGDEIPVSLMPADGTSPSGTAVYEKRNVADVVPVWEPDICVQCGQCSFVCPHSVIRAKYYRETELADAPARFKSAPINVRGFPEVRFSLQFYVEDCTGCGLCIEACPAHSPTEPGLKAINLRAKQPLVEAERRNVAFFEALPVNDRARVDFANVRGVQFLEPLFEFSGACAGCGETPYLKLLSQLFGDRMMVANATGCSSIYGGNLPVTPWSKNHEGRGPAWSNSLFEDDAEFGLGFRLAADKQLDLARTLLQKLRHKSGRCHSIGTSGPRVGNSRATPARHDRNRALEDANRRHHCQRSAVGRRSSGASQHLDRRRRRVGLRHWLWRSGPCFSSGARRQCIGARYRSLFQYRRTDVEGDAARRHCKVCCRRQADSAEGFGATGYRLRQCLCRISRDGRQPAAHPASLSRGGGLSRSVANPRLLSLHCPRYRYAARHAAAGFGGRLRLLAAVPLQSSNAGDRRKPVPPQLAAPNNPVSRLRL